MSSTQQTLEMIKKLKHRRSGMDMLSEYDMIDSIFKQIRKGKADNILFHHNEFNNRNMMSLNYCTNVIIKDCKLSGRYITLVQTFRNQVVFLNNEISPKAKIRVLRFSLWGLKLYTYHKITNIINTYIND